MADLQQTAETPRPILATQDWTRAEVNALEGRFERLIREVRAETDRTILENRRDLDAALTQRREEIDRLIAEMRQDAAMERQASVAERQAAESDRRQMQIDIRNQTRWIIGIGVLLVLAILAQPALA